MPNRQLDLFMNAPGLTADAEPPSERSPPVAAELLDDVALLAAIPGSGRAEGPSLAAEAGRRRLTAAIPVLADYCRRFAGFGANHRHAEQTAALQALGLIGGAEAARHVAEIVMRGWAEGPNLATAVAVAAHLRSRLPAATVLSLLRHPERAVPRDACRLATADATVAAVMVDLLGDLHSDVSLAAACALARIGRAEARARLKLALFQAPSAAVIEAIPAIADEDCVVQLGRMAVGAQPDLAAAARDALEAIDHPRAAQLVQRLQT